MGKASQAKKVARAARAAQPTRASRRRWLWPAGLLALLVVGVLVIYAARGQSHPAPTPQIANEDTTTTATIASSVTAGTGSTSTTAAGATSTTAATGATGTTAGGSSTTSPSTTAAPSTTAKP